MSVQSFRESNFSTIGKTIVKQYGLGMIIGLVAAALVQAQSLTNPNFEEPRITPGVEDVAYPMSIPGWSTTDSNFELWTDGVFGRTPYRGNQFIELNAFSASTLSQVLTGLSANDLITYRFAHRGRDGDDTARMVVTDLGADNAPGGTGANTDTVLLTRDVTTDETDWVLYNSDDTGGAILVASGNDVLLEFFADSTSSGDTSQGNFLDDVDIGVNVAVPVELQSFEID